MRPVFIIGFALILSGCFASKSFNDPAQRDCIAETTIASSAATKRGNTCLAAMASMRFATLEAEQAYATGCRYYANKGEELQTLSMELKRTLGISFSVEGQEDTEAKIDQIARSQEAVDAAIESARSCAANYIK